MKLFFFNFLENNDYKYKKYFDVFMLVLIFISVVILLREVKHEVNASLLFINAYIISFIFLVEYLLRVWISENKIKYIFSFQAIIDLFAILPFFHHLRILRIFVLFRVFKLFRYAKSIQTFTSIIRTKKFELLTLLIFSSIVIFLSSIMIYVMEASNSDSSITTLFEALYWSIVTISTVGYGDVAPLSVEGRVVAMFVIVAGIVVFSFTTSLIVTSFTQKLDEIKELKDINDIANIDSFYLLCGYNYITKDIARNLNEKVLVFEPDIQKYEKAKKDGFLALNYDPSSTKSYKSLNINFDKQVLGVVCLSDFDVVNVDIALSIRSLSKDTYILSLLNKKENRSKLEFIKINHVVCEEELVAHSLVLDKKNTDKIAFVFGVNDYAKELEKRFNSIYSSVVLDSQIEMIVDSKGLCDAFCTHENMAENIFLTISLREKYPDLNIISMSASEENTDKLLLAGATSIMPITRITAREILNTLHRKNNED